MAVNDLLSVKLPPAEPVPEPLRRRSSRMDDSIRDPSETSSGKNEDISKEADRRMTK